MKTPDMLTQYRGSIQDFWNKREVRERKVLAVSAVIAMLGLIYALLIDPALSGRAKLKHDLPELRQQVAQMQALSRQAAALSATPAPAVETVSRDKIDAALGRHSLKAQSVLLTGEYVKIQLVAAPFSATLTWLDELQKSLRLSVADAEIAALDKPDLVNVKLTLRQIRNE